MISDIKFFSSPDEYFLLRFYSIESWLNILQMQNLEFMKPMKQG